MWGVGYGFLIVLTLACALTVWRSSGSSTKDRSESTGTDAAPAQREKPRPGDVYSADSMDAGSVCSLQLDAECHHLPFHQHCTGPSALGPSPIHLFAHINSGVR